MRTRSTFAEFAGGSRPSPAASGRRRVRASVHDLTVLKSYDAASPHLTLATLRGQAFDEIVLTVRKDSGEAHLDYPQDHDDELRADRLPDGE